MLPVILRRKDKFVRKFMPNGMRHRLLCWSGASYKPQKTMKFFQRSFGISALLICLFSAGSAFAQPSRVAFVTGDHSKIFFTDGTTLDSTTIIDTASVNTALRKAFYTGITSVSKLSVLSATADGKRLLIAGHFLFPNSTTTLQDSADAIIQLDAPFLLGNFFDFATKFKILKRINPPVNSVNLSIPLGVIAANNVDWYATWTGSQIGSPSLWFYHGHLDQIDTGANSGIDSILYPMDQTHQIQGDYHMSNLAASPGGNIMVAIIVDQLSNQVNGPDFHAVRWEPHPNGPTQIFRTTLFTSSVQGKFNLPVVSRDFNFGLGLRVKDNNIAEMILAKDSGADLITQTYDYNGNAIVLTDGIVIPRTMIPSTEYFFDGYNAEVDPQAKQRGNGGDIMFVGQSDSILFLTHASVNYNDYSKSRIRIGAISSGTSQILYDNGPRHPLHPVWLQGVPAAPPKHEYIALSVAQLDLGTVIVGKSISKQVTVSNPSDSIVTVDHVTLTGPDASEFSVTPTGSYTLAVGATQIETITWAPHDPISVHHAMLTVTFDGRADSLRQVVLSGTVQDTAHVGVAMSTNTITSLTIAPNPTHNNTTITLEAAKSGMMQLEIRDVLGRVVYSLDPKMIAGGSSNSVQFDASSLGRSNGTYYLSASVAGETITRKLVLLK